MNLKEHIRGKLTSIHNCRNAFTTYRENFITKLLCFNNDIFSEDFVSLHTSFKNSVAGLLMEKYNELLKPYKIFKKMGIYQLYKRKTIDAEELLEIKKVNYYILRNYYNNHILPVLQELNDHPSGEHNVFPVIGYKFRYLKNRSHLII